MSTPEPGVLAFSDTVREYCRFIEEDETAQSREYVLYCLRLLLTLHQHALDLPDLVAEENLEDEETIDSQWWNAIRERIASKLDRDGYWMIFDPFEEPSSPVASSLSDDLSDIWRDLKAGLLQFDSGRQHAVASAVWSWRFGFAYHWGSNHSAHAIEALHALLFGEHAH